MAAKGFAIAAGALLLGLAGALPARATPPTALTSHDAALYEAAFDAAQRGDTAAADQALAQVSDSCLVGNVQYVELTHGGPARPASYEELNRWLKTFGDLPGATQLYELALKLRPTDALPPPPATAASTADVTANMRPAPQSKPAREAYFNGDVRRALDLARSSGDAWIAGLAAYRLGQFADAMVSFETLAANPTEVDAVRAAGGFWAARAAVAAGLTDRVQPLLKIAAAAPHTFYGMIAKRKLELSDDPLGRLIDAASSGAVAVTLSNDIPLRGESALERLERTDPRAHRAAALAQIGRQGHASAEARDGLAAASDDASRALWTNLMYELGPGRTGNGEIVLSASAPVSGGAQVSYPTPQLQPAGGFTIDKALVYAVVWQESRFNDLAVSPVGAVGLMQLMPPSAASVAGDPTIASDPIGLFDRGRNLELGQAYIRWLEQNSGGYDLLRTVAAYNGGPTTLVRTEEMLGPTADSLLVIESLPYAETRAYVKKVVAAYWTYRREFGAPTKTLDAAASGQPTIDARLDAPAPASAPIQDAQSRSTARQALEILLHHDG